MSANVTHIGTLHGHRDWVTSIATTHEKTNLIVTGSRDKTAIVWELTPPEGMTNEQEAIGYARRSLQGHNQGVCDTVISSDGQFCLTGSMDATMRLWDLNNGTCVRRFKGHTKDVHSVAFSPDNRQIVSGSRDKTIKLWNTLAECKYTMTEKGHTDWVSCVRFSPSAKNPLIVSCGWDKLIKVWNLNNCTLKTNLPGHTEVVNTITISPDGSLCGSGGKDGTAMLWDVNEGKNLYSLDAGSVITAMCFSPKNYWLCAATDTSVKVWDLENKEVLANIEAPVKENATAVKSGLPWCTSIQWSTDGDRLFCGTTEGTVHVFSVTVE